MLWYIYICICDGYTSKLTIFDTQYEDVGMSIELLNSFSPGNYVLIEPSMISHVRVCLCVCVCVTIDSIANNFWGTYRINLKFCSLILKAIVRLKIQNSLLKLFPMTRRGRQYGSKQHFFQFFKNNSKTKREPFLIFWYVIQIIISNIFCQMTKFKKLDLGHQNLAWMLKSSTLFESDIIHGNSDCTWKSLWRRPWV